jgi:hypothetical protein
MVKPDQAGNAEEAPAIAASTSAPLLTAHFPIAEGEVKGELKEGKGSVFGYTPEKIADYGETRVVASRIIVEDTIERYILKYI